MKIRILPTTLLCLAVMAMAIAAHDPLRGQGVADVADERTTAADVLAADDLRIAAMTTADETELERLLDDDLHYGHSSGTIDTKESLIDAITSGRLTYSAFEPAERTVSFPTPEIAIVAGQAAVTVEAEKGRQEFRLGFLSVWRQVCGEWKFLAWQSVRVPAREH